MHYDAQLDFVNRLLHIPKNYTIIEENFTIIYYNKK